MKRLYFSSILLCLLCVVNIGDAYTVDEVFQNFKTAYSKCKNFSADFEETTLYKTRKSVSRGRFTFGIPNLLNMEYVSPRNPDKVVKTIVLDGVYAWSYTPLLNEVNKQRMQNPQRREILPGAGATLEELSNNWNMELVPDKAANAKGIYQILMTPKPNLLKRDVKQKLANKEIEKKQEDGGVKEILEIWVNESKWFPVQFGYVTVYADGSRRNVVMKLSNIERDKKLPEDIFKFVIPKDAEIIDLSEN